MNTVVEDLKAAKALIADPKNWLQGGYARDAQGVNEYLMGNDEGAICFCSLGALQKVANTMHEEDTDAYEVLTQTAIALGATSVPSYNDNHTHAEVMAFWDKAIETAEAESKGE